jgi:hypothetical protein
MGRCQLGQTAAGVSIGILVAEGPLQVQRKTREAFGTHHLAGGFEAEDRIECTVQVPGGQR